MREIADGVRKSEIMKPAQIGYFIEFLRRAGKSIGSQPALVYCTKDFLAVPVDDIPNRNDLLGRAYGASM
jgi:hypothetical protein